MTVTSIKEAEVTVKGEKKRIQNVAARFPGPVLNEVSITLWNPALFNVTRVGLNVHLVFFTIKSYKSVKTLQSTAVSEVTALSVRAG